MKINAVIIDTFSQRRFVQIALDMVSKCPNIDEIYLLSDHPEIGYQYIEINKINNIADYNKLMLQALPRLFNDSYIMTFQWDGFPVNPQS